MIVKTEEEWQGLREIGAIVAHVRDALIAQVRVGVTTLELDKLGGELLAKHGAESAPIKMYEFPGFTCISVNETVAHGIPGDYVIKEGDIVNVDVSAYKNGFYADTGATTVAGSDVSPLKQRLLETAELVVDVSIKKARAGAKLNSLGAAVYREARKRGFHIVQNLTGHGIGRSLHEEPEHIVSYYDPDDTTVLEEGHVIALESFVSTGADHVVQGTDGWALQTTDGSLVAQFEHTVVVTKDKAVILTLGGQLD
ncbi:methionine aminopeptidase, type I [Paenibacillus curdlanolyticus YK9]|uniref:Methionine aminopeptidase n=1 Tax=Paenibacillus curdlanolyticus YK9 TaxID=717606 RepID=E0I4Y0_9BACL|nr:type I methionyl aminopeptidase [Paenibacillus curdlanolyticus]EFM12022.1 methionine aminopeptidase, type I [Paenibacillus curdlanolyticus YK9]